MLKIFDISFPRCGTTSTSVFLGALGFKPCKSDLKLYNNLICGEVLDWSNVEENDAFGDAPFCVPQVFVTAKLRYPDAKFIYTIRPVDDWLRSVRGLLSIDPPRVAYYWHNILAKVIMYGYHEFNEEVFRQVFIHRQKLIEDTFSDCPERLLVVSLYDQKIGDKIMDFVGVHKDAVFPWQNRQTLGRFKLW